MIRVSTESLFSKAKKSEKKGNLREAASLYLEVLSHFPKNVRARQSIDRIRRKQSKLEGKPPPDGFRSIVECIKEKRFNLALQSSIALSTSQPSNYLLFNLKGVAHLGLNNLEKAREAFEQVVNLNSTFADGLNNLGHTELLLGNHKNATIYLQQACTLTPESYLFWNNLGNALQQSKRFTEAFSSYNKALTLNEAYAEAHYNLGTNLRSLGELNTAITHLKRSIELMPKFEKAFNNLGAIYLDLDDQVEALKCFKYAIKINPRFADAHLNICELYEKSSDLKSLSITLVEAQKQLGSNNSDLKFYEAVLEFREKNELNAKDILMQIPQNEISVHRRVSLLKTKAQVFQSIGEYQGAYKMFDSMNKLAVQISDFPMENAERYFYKIKKDRDILVELGSTPTVIDENSDTSYPATFIIGFPRSGTTLLDVILSSHSKIITIEEKPILQSVIKQLDQGSIGEIEGWSTLQRSQAQNCYLKEIKKYVEISSSSMIIDKLPLNILNLPFIHNIFPSGKIILAIRHPFDAILSSWMQNFSLNSAMANFTELKRTVQFYCISMEIFDLCEKRYDLDVHILKYENLLDNFELETKKMLSFLGLDWEDSIKNFNVTAQRRDKISTPSYSQVVQPIYKNASQRWRNYNQQLKPYFKDIAPWIEKYGYA